MGYLPYSNYLWENSETERGGDGLTLANKLNRSNFVHCVKCGASIHDNTRYKVEANLCKHFLKLFQSMPLSYCRCCVDALHLLSCSLSRCRPLNNITVLGATVAVSGFEKEQHCGINFRCWEIEKFFRVDETGENKSLLFKGAPTTTMHRCYFKPPGTSSSMHNYFSRYLCNNKEAVPFEV